MRPFATEQEYEATVENVRSFKEGIGQVLQQKLLHRASTKRNWVSASPQVVTGWFSLCGVFIKSPFSPAGGVVAGHGLPGAADALSAQRQLWRAGPLPGALLAPR